MACHLCSLHYAVDDMWADSHVANHNSLGVDGAEQSTCLFARRHIRARHVPLLSVWYTAGCMLQRAAAQSERGTAWVDTCAKGRCVSLPFRCLPTNAAVVR